MTEITQDDLELLDPEVRIDAAFINTFPNTLSEKDQEDQITWSDLFVDAGKKVLTALIASQKELATVKARVGEFEARERRRESALPVEPWRP